MTSRPWRYLAVLVGLLIVMFATIIGNDVSHPGTWHDKFKVQLGLDLSSGTTVTIRAVPLKEHGTRQTVPSASAMTQSIAILNSRVNGQGFTGAKVQQQGSNLIVVSVPGKSAEQIAPLLSSAVLRFRQVLLTAPGRPIALPPPGTGTTPPPTASPVAEFLAVTGWRVSLAEPVAVGLRRQRAGRRSARARRRRPREDVGQRLAESLAVGIGQPERVSERSGVSEPESESEAHQAAGHRCRRLGRHHQDHQQGRDHRLQPAELLVQGLAEADLR